ncbi:MAG: nucleotidyl transferase AbiEii/AbiGii toxin family protein [Elusimicrobia bacterium]|nr:nucleotidyl transferase AbiEii/AbiGii toxin family protein [Elusimicrobiota bacterium]
MDKIARLPAHDRAELFRAAALQRGTILPTLIEKDFWVCWTLKRVFALENPSAGLIFKGGTSLSKVYQVTDRFSEDVDLTFDRGALGYGGDNDPAKAGSGKKTGKKLDELSAACRKMISHEFMPRLEKAFAAALGSPPATGNWQIALAADDPDLQTILFRYPVGITENDDPAARYLRPAVRLEFGARGEQWPAEDGTVTPYAAEIIPKPFTEPSCRVKVLAAQRTFWEKATILHAYYYWPEGKDFPQRQSRHYFDLAKLHEKGIGAKALADLELLKSVARHKSIFFRSAAAQYDKAVPGSLNLVPPATRRKELADDYAKMREMIFGDVPPLDHIFDVLAALERTINAKQ